MITVKHLYKDYSNGGELLHVIEDLSLHIKKGSMVAIMGRSGCGKSTLLNIMGGLLTPTAGQVCIDGFPLAYENKKMLYELRRKYFGYVVQNFALIPQKTVWENVLLTAFPRKDRKAASSAEELLGIVGLSDKKHKYPFQLSNGERQRTAIARALVGDRQILLADEPTGALDFENAQNIMNLLSALNRTKGTTIVLVTHDKDIADQCHQTILL